MYVLKVKIENSQVLLKDIRLYAHHGVLPQERIVGAYFIVNVSVEVDFSMALGTDDLDGTISYADIFDLVRREMEVPSNLLEHVAGRIGKAILANFDAATAVDIELLKENPPIGADRGEAGVSVRLLR